MRSPLLVLGSAEALTSATTTPAASAPATAALETFVRIPAFALGRLLSVCIAAAAATVTAAAVFRPLAVLVGLEAQAALPGMVLCGSLRGIRRSSGARGLAIARRDATVEASGTATLTTSATTPTSAILVAAPVLIYARGGCSVRRRRGARLVARTR